MEPEITGQTERAEAVDRTGALPEPLATDLEARLDALIATRIEAVMAGQREAERERLLQRFGADNPDFAALAAKGELEAQKRLHPLLDDVGAYFAHKLMVERQEHEQALGKARESAEAEAETQTMERLRAKRLARTLGPAPAGAGRGQGRDPELADPAKFGGINAVLAARLRARRQSAGN